MRTLSIIRRLASANQCDYDAFFNSQLNTSGQCLLAKSAECIEQQQAINFFEFLFCDLNGNTFWFILLAILIIILVFRFISTTVDKFLAPAITYISEYLGLSEPMAAVTLLALANGAGDVITAIVASGTDGAIAYNVGSLFGAGLFCCTLVVAITILKSETKIQLQYNIIYRDVFMYMVSTIVVMIFAATKSITTADSLVLLSLYLLLVIIVKIQDSINHNRQENEKQLLKQDSDSVVNKFKRAVKKIQIMNNLQVYLRRDKEKLLVDNLEENEEENEGLISKFIFTLDYPFHIMRQFTMLPIETEDYNKFYALVWPFFGVLFYCWQIQPSPTWKWLYIGFPCGIVSFILLWSQHRFLDERPKKLFILNSLVSAVTAIMWTYLVTSYLIDLLTMIGVIAQLNQTYLGLTILAIGNALPDAVTTISLAGKGYALMGLTGTYAGQLFGLLVGFGLSMLNKTIKDGTQDFVIYEDLSDNFLDLFAIITMLICLITTFIYGIINKYEYGKGLAYALLAIYIVFIVCATIVQLIIMIHGSLPI